MANLTKVVGQIMAVGQLKAGQNFACDQLKASGQPNYEIASHVPV
jgi:hypothetical protein